MPVGYRSGYWQRLYQPRRKVNPANTQSSARVFTRQTDWRTFLRHFDSLYMRPVSLFSSRPDLLSESFRQPTSKVFNPPFQGRHPIDFKCRESYKYGSTALGTPCLSGRSQGLMVAPISNSRPDGRSGKRIPQILLAELSRPDESVSKELTFTENVRLHGARVVTVRRWLPETRVLVIFLRNGLRSEARVAYCQRKETGGFAIGVELSGASRA